MINPFPGLRSFEPDEDHLFFGREKQIDDLLGRLRRTRFLSVVGGSGSGKSSLVRSGLIPSLHSGLMAKAGSSWRVALMRPGGDPLGNLSAALCHPDALGADPALGDMGRELTAAALRRSALGLVECVRQARTPSTDNVLVVVDQFEELFRFKQAAGARDEAVAFVKLLLEAARDERAPIYVVLTMRSEFIGQCAEFPGLAEVVNDGQYLVPRMTRDELRLAITGPIAVGGGQIAPRLVTRVLNEIGDNPDQLPILQHALMRTWDAWVGRGARDAIDFADYEAIGTMSDALSRHAEEAYAEIASSRGQELAEAAFKALTELTPQGGLRRPSRLDELAAIAGADVAEINAVLEHFRRSGRSFLIASTMIDGTTIVDLSHESLMRVWTRLDRWTREEARAAEIYRRLCAAADLHSLGETGLWRDPELQLAINWREAQQPTARWAERYNPAFDRAIGFLTDSQRERDRVVADAERQRRKQLVRARVVAAVLAVFAVGAGVSLWFAVLNSREASRQRQQAIDEKNSADAAAREAQRQSDRATARERDARDANAEAQRQAEIARTQATLATAQKYAATVATTLAERNAADARREKDEADRQRADADRSRDRAKTLQTAAEEASKRADRERDAAEGLRVAADRRARFNLAKAITASAAGRWEPGQWEAAALLARQAYVIYGKLAVATSHNDDLFGAFRNTLKGLAPGSAALYGPHGDSVRAVAVTEDGSRLIAGTDDGLLTIFDPQRSNAPLATLGRLGDSPIRAVAVDSARRRLAVGSLDGVIRVWDLNHLEAPLVAANGRVGVVTQVLFDARGRLFFSGGDGVVAAIDLSNAAALAAAERLTLARQRLQDRLGTLLLTVPAKITAIAVSADGTTLAAATERLGLRLRDVRTLEATGAIREGNPVTLTAVAFTLGSQQLVAGTEDGRLLSYALSGGQVEPRGSVHAHDGVVTSLVFRRNARARSIAEANTLASASLDGTAKLWPMDSIIFEGPQAGFGPVFDPLVLRDHSGWVWSLALTGDGRRVFTGSADRTVRSSMTSVRDLADEICRHVRRELTPEEWERWGKFDSTVIPAEPSACSPARTATTAR